MSDDGYEGDRGEFVVGIVLASILIVMVWGIAALVWYIRS